MRERLRRLCMLDLARRPLLLAGSGRSGTTWLAELINWRGDHRLIWEPLNVEQVPETRPLGARRYLHADHDASELRSVWRRVLDGRIRGPWIDSFNTRLLYRRRLVKVIRGNLMLAWSARWFADVPIILLLRHPGAVVDSWRRQNWKQRLSAQPLLAQRELVERHGLHAWVGGERNELEEALLTWCIENIVPLREVPADRMRVVFYEDLVRDPEGQLQRVMAWCGLPFDRAMLDGVRTPSAMSGQGSPLQRGGDPVTAWADHVDADTRDMMARMLASFGFDRIYSEDGRPCVAPDEASASITSA
jgi:hypothetical protein